MERRRILKAFAVATAPPLLRLAGVAPKAPSGLAH